MGAVMTAWFTTDTHFGHENMIRFCKRPFSSAVEMDERLIKNWNQVVGPNDIDCHLGDFTLAGKIMVRKCFQRLNGKIQVIPGEYYKRWLKKGTYYSGPRHQVTILPHCRQ